MPLTTKQKKYIKKKITKRTVEQIAKSIGVKPVIVIKFLGLKSKPNKHSANHMDSFNLKLFFKKNSLTLVVLSVFVFALYANSINNDFVSDDIFGIVNNPNIGTTKYLLKNLFIFPGRRILHFLSYNLGGLTPSAFRIPNILFHIANTWAVFALVSIVSNKKAGTYASFVFAAHPILVESVTWITGGAYTKYSLFFLLGLIYYMLPGNNKRNYFLSVIFFLASAAFGAGAIAFPLVITTYELSKQTLVKNWKKVMGFVTIPLLAALPFYKALLQRIELLQTANYSSAELYNPFTQIPTAITKYLELIFWPSRLTLYQSELATNTTGLMFRWGVLTAFVALLVFYYKRDRLKFFLLSIFPLSLLPTLTPLPIAWVVAERYVYLGTVGIIAIIAIYLADLSDTGKYRGCINYFVIIITIALGIRTIIRNTDWKNQNNLWVATAKYSQSSPNTHNNLGDVYGRAGDLERAAAEFKAAIEIKPDYADAYHNLANTYRDMGKTDLAISNYKKAAELNPNLWQSYQNLAAIYFEQEDFETATKYMVSAIEINPQNANLYLNLGIIYQKSGEEELAAKSFSKAVELNPQLNSVINSLDL